MGIDSDEDAEDIADFVRDVFQQFRGVGQANNHPLIIAPDVKDAALRIREAANPAQELIPPSFLPFEVLAFFHALSCLITSQVTSSRSVFS